MAGKNSVAYLQQRMDTGIARLKCNEYELAKKGFEAVVDATSWKQNGLFHSCASFGAGLADELLTEQEKGELPTRGFKELTEIVEGFWDAGLMLCYANMEADEEALASWFIKVKSI